MLPILLTFFLLWLSTCWVLCLSSCWAVTCIDTDLGSLPIYSLSILKLKHDRFKKNVTIFNDMHKQNWESRCQCEITSFFNISQFLNMSFHCALSWCDSLKHLYYQAILVCVTAKEQTHSTPILICVDALTHSSSIITGLCHLASGKRISYLLSIPTRHILSHY